MVVKLRRNLAIFSTDLTLDESVFQRLGTPTAKTLVPILTLGTKHKPKLGGHFLVIFSFVSLDFSRSFPFFRCKFPGVDS